VIADILDDRGEPLAEELGDAAYFQHLDVTSEDDWEAAIPEAESRFGVVNVLVNNAAILHLATIADTSADDFRRVLDVNLVGPMLGIRAVTPAMRRAGGGSIVNVASIMLSIHTMEVYVMHPANGGYGALRELLPSNWVCMEFE